MSVAGIIYKFAHIVPYISILSILVRCIYAWIFLFYNIEINWILRCNKLNFMLKKFEQNLSLKYFFCSVFSNKMNALHTHILNRTYSPYEWLLYVSRAPFQAEIWWQMHAVPTRPEPHFFLLLIWIHLSRSTTVQFIYISASIERLFNIIELISR